MSETGSRACMPAHSARAGTVVGVLVDGVVRKVLVRRAPAALKLLLGGARRHLVAVGAELLGREEPEVVGGVVVAALHDGVVRERAQHRHRLPLLPRLLERLLQREEEERGVSGVGLCACA